MYQKDKSVGQSTIDRIPGTSAPMKIYLTGDLSGKHLFE